MQFGVSEKDSLDMGNPQLSQDQVHAVRKDVIESTFSGVGVNDCLVAGGRYCFSTQSLNSAMNRDPMEPFV